jgi:hypothetical protein
LPATERSSGYLGLKIDWKDGRVASYKLQVDFTYDRDTKAAVPAALEKNFGKPTEWKHPQLAGVSCSQYGKNVYACDGEKFGLQRITTWTIYVGKPPR